MQLMKNKFQSSDCSPQKEKKAYEEHDYLECIYSFPHPSPSKAAGEGRLEVSKDRLMDEVKKGVIYLTRLLIY